MKAVLSIVKCKYVITIITVGLSNLNYNFFRAKIK